MKIELSSASAVACRPPRNTDASPIRLAGVLIKKKGAKERVVAYYSRQTTNIEQRYHSFELETLAMVESIKNFRHYLLRRPFVIITDCSAVQGAFSKQALNSRIGRWILSLSEFHYELKHRSGSQMRHVDALSRNPSVTVPNKTCAVLIKEADWLLAAQQQDSSIQNIKTILETGDQEKHRQTFNTYALKGGKIYRITNHGLRWVVPKMARFQVVRMNHDDCGHFAFDKTSDLQKNKFWFKHMRRFVTKYIKNCLNCLYFKIAGGRKPGFLHPIPKTPVPFHTIHIDHMGPFVKTISGNTQIFVIIDAFTKFILIYPVKNTKTKYVIQSLKDMIKVFGVPCKVISDRGSAFTSQNFTQYCHQIGTTHYLTAVGLPRANGQVERYNRTILDALSTMGANKRADKWDENIGQIQVGLNGTLNTAIGLTPSEALFGIRVLSHASMDLDRESVDVTAMRKKLVECIKFNQDRQKQYFDTKRGQPRQYQVGDLVLTRITSLPSTGSSQKLMPKWKGPFRVTKQHAADRYEVV